MFEFADQLPAAEVEYQQRAIGCGTGEPISIRGSPVLVVRFDGAVAHDAQGNSSVGATRFDGSGESIQEVKLTCDFEAEVTWALGMSGLKPFKFATWTNPPRLVVDIGW